MTGERLNKQKRPKKKEEKNYNKKNEMLSDNTKNAANISHIKDMVASYIFLFCSLNMFLHRQKSVTAMKLSKVPEVS